MKAFLILLFLTNIIFALVQWLLPFEQVMNKARPPEVIASLHLLSESDSPLKQEPVQEEPPPPPVEQSAEVEIDEDVAEIIPAKPVIPAIPDKLCYTLGPFKDQQRAQEVALKFKQNKIPISSRSSQEKEYRGVMVYVGGHKTRRDAIATAESLAKKGVRDYIIVKEPDRPHLLSLGVFGLKRYAERRKSKIAKMGYPVKSEERYLNRTIYWLDYSESENENLTQFIDNLKKEKGISRISRQCGE